MRRVGVALFFLAAVFMLFGRSARGGTGSIPDPVGDVFDGPSQLEGGGKLDIVNVSHADDGLKATYTITTKDAFKTF